MLKRLLAIILFVAPTGAHAIPDPAFWESLAPSIGATDERRSASAEADQLIQANNVGDLFANVTEANVPRLRHGPTGLVCSFYGDGAKVIEVGDGGAGPERDEMVICRSRVGAQPLVQAAIRNPEGVPLDKALDDFVAGVARTYPDMVAQGEVTYSSGGGLARAARRSYIVNRDPNSLIIYVTFARHGDWGVGQIMIGRADRADQIRGFADREFDRARREIGERQATGPAM